jgi:hypothetical protein
LLSLDKRVDVNKKFAVLILANAILHTATPVWATVSGYNDAQAANGYIRGWRITVSDDPGADAFFHVSIGATIDPWDYDYYPLSEYSWTYSYADIAYCMPGSHQFVGRSASAGAGHIDSDQMTVMVSSMSQCC